ncbi:serine/threonine-protein kinase PINK1, mitochondrial [Engraulis encrasicolus]|uniref:serine/threonine-protein kinase PINK1, mitochondrial n=1 Tax=Engraulis encrasicolus TaxID=184585 RepID=UPI002FD6117E
MSVKHAISRGVELGRSAFQLGILKPAGRLAAKFRGERLRVGQPSRTVQPQSFLPARYQYYRMSLSGLAAQMQSGGFRRLIGGSPRNRVVFLAFGVGLGLIEQQFEDDRKSVAACQQIQALFQKKKFESPIKSFMSGYKLEDYVIGKQIGKGCNAAVYEAAAPFAPVPPRRSERASLVELNTQPSERTSPRLACPTRYPLAVKMMWNMGAGSSSEAILNSMSQELVPATPNALRQDEEGVSLDGQFGWVPKTVAAHPNVIKVHRAFTADVPLLPGAEEEYPAVLPTRLNPLGMGNNRTLFLVMKNYPYTLRQYLESGTPGRKTGTLMALQLLEGVDHLCRQGIAHRDLKSDNILMEFDFGGCPRLVITDFGCCLADQSCGLQLPYNSRWVSRGGNACLMAPEVATAVPGPGVTIDYSKADAWAVGTICYEIFGQRNPFYCPQGLEGRSYEERQLPELPSNTPADTKLVVRLLLRRNPKKRPSARVAANMLHLSLWGRQALTSLDRASLSKLSDWLLCQSAYVLLRGRGPSGSSVEAELQRGFLASLDLEELRTALAFLTYGRQLHHDRYAPLTL